MWRCPISIHVRKVIPFYFDDPVRQFSQTGYQIKGTGLQMYSEFFLTLRTQLCCAGVALRKRKSVKNAHKFAFIADENSQ